MLLRRNLFGVGSYTFRMHCQRSITSPVFKAVMIYTLVMWIIISVIGLLGYWMVRSSYNDGADKRIALARSFDFQGLPDQVARDQRKQLAAAILRLDEAGATDTVNQASWSIKYDRRDELSQQLADIVHTGEPLRIDTAKFTWGGLWILLKGELFLLWISFAMLLYWTYMAECRRRKEHPADLPWQRGWPVLFMVLSFPMCFAYIPDAIKVAKAYWPLTYYRRYGQVPQPESEQQQAQSQLEVARRDYAGLRQQHWRKAAIRRLEDVGKRITQIMEELNAAATSLQSLHSERSVLQAEEMQLQSLGGEVLQLGSKTPQEEFDALHNLQGVRIVEVEDQDLVLIIDITHAYDGWLYDAGAWRMVVKADGSFHVICLRAGINAGWTKTYHPDYRYPDDKFCFRNQTEIEDRLRKGDIYGAVALAVSTMNSVNESDRANIPEAFMRLRQLSTAEKLELEEAHAD